MEAVRLVCRLPCPCTLSTCSLLVAHPPPSPFPMALSLPQSPGSWPNTASVHFNLRAHIRTVSLAHGPGLQLCSLPAVLPCLPDHRCLEKWEEVWDSGIDALIMCPFHGLWGWPWCESCLHHFLSRRPGNTFVPQFLHLNKLGRLLVPNSEAVGSQDMQNTS